MQSNDFDTNLATQYEQAEQQYQYLERSKRFELFMFNTLMAITFVLSTQGHHHSKMVMAKLTLYLLALLISLRIVYHQYQLKKNRYYKRMLNFQDSYIFLITGVIITLALCISLGEIFLLLETLPDSAVMKSVILNSSAVLMTILLFFAFIESITNQSDKKIKTLIFLLMMCQGMSALLLISPIQGNNFFNWLAFATTFCFGAFIIMRPLIYKLGFSDVKDVIMHADTVDKDSVDQCVY